MPAGVPLLPPPPVPPLPLPHPNTKRMTRTIAALKVTRGQRPGRTSIARVTSSNSHCQPMRRLIRGETFRGAGPGDMIERDVVVIVAVAVAAIPLSVTEAGKEQEAAGGLPLQLSVTGPPVSPPGVTVTVKVVDCPAVIVAALGAAEIVKAARVPVPESGTVCGLPTPLSVIVSVAFRPRVAVGVNVTLIVQLAPAASVDGDMGQLLDCAKSPLPVIVRFVIVKFALPMLVSVVTRAALVVPISWFPKARLDGDRLTGTPVPIRFRICGLPAALSLIVIAAVLGPAVVGANVTLIEQFAPPATLVPQVLFCVNSPLFVPVIATLLMVNVAVPALPRITDCGALVVPKV